jgi:hypothetical protein
VAHVSAHVVSKPIRTTALRPTGFPVSGFEVLRYLDVKIDYRDGLVDFSYVPKPFSR